MASEEESEVYQAVQGTGSLKLKGIEVSKEKIASLKLLPTAESLFPALTLLAPPAQEKEEEQEAQERKAGEGRRRRIG